LCNASGRIKGSRDRDDQALPRICRRWRSRAAPDYGARSRFRSGQGLNSRHFELAQAEGGHRRATMELNTYLPFNGQCGAAFKFYEQVLGGKIEFMLTYGASAMAAQVPAEWHGKILHATLNVDNKVLQGADGPPDHKEEMKGFAVAIGP